VLYLTMSDTFATYPCLPLATELVRAIMLVQASKLPSQKRRHSADVGRADGMIARCTLKTSSLH